MPFRRRRESGLRLATLAVDYWELESAEQRHASHPDTFWLPPRAERESLRPGQVVKLIFRLEGTTDDGEVVIETERMWVFVTEVVPPDAYIGILDNQPAAYEPADDVYLVLGAEVPFKAEHVIDIVEPPEDYAAWQRANAPLRVWPRGA